jgi:hypothetical protein
MISDKSIREWQDGQNLTFLMTYPFSGNYISKLWKICDERVKFFSGSELALGLPNYDCDQRALFVNLALYSVVRRRPEDSPEDSQGLSRLGNLMEANKNLARPFLFPLDPSLA